MSENKKIENNKEELTFFYSDSCPNCGDAKILYKPHIDSGKFKMLKLESEEGAKIANELKINAVPAIIYKNKVTHEVKVCELSQSGDRIYCPNNEEVKL